METRRLHSPIFELMQHDHYTPQELADLLEVGIDVVRHASFTGELPATIVNHDIVSIRREDVLTWLQQRGGTFPSSTADRSD